MTYEDQLNKIDNANENITAQIKRLEEVQKHETNKTKAGTLRSIIEFLKEQSAKIEEATKALR